MLAAPLAARPRGFGTLELDVQSSYAHIRIRRQGTLRSLLFVRDGGEEMCETAVNLKKPYELQLSYVRYMFASYLFRPVQQRALIVGLGGGAMVQFLKDYHPPLAVDAVEIDPGGGRSGHRYFGTRSEGKVHVETADGYEYLRHSQRRYAAIYLDAFLPPSDETDAVGVPARLRRGNSTRTCKSGWTRRAWWFSI